GWWGRWCERTSRHVPSFAAVTGFMFFLARLLQVILALALPIALGEIAWLVIRWLGPADFWRVPAFTGAAKLLGLIVGIVLLLSQYDPAFFDPHRLFTPDSPWNVSLWGFLGRRVNPLDYAIRPIVQWFSAEDSYELRLVSLLAMAALLIAVAAMPFYFWKRAVGPIALLSALLLAVVTAYLTVYFVCLALWTLYLLNFWSLALIIVVF